MPVNNGPHICIFSNLFKDVTWVLKSLFAKRNSLPVLYFHVHHFTLVSAILFHEFFNSTSVLS